MKKASGVLFVFVALLSVGTTNLCAKPPKLKAEDAIRAVLDAQVAAWNRGDLDTFMESYWNSGQVEFVGSTGIFRGWQAVLERYRKTYPDRRAMGTVKFTDLEITMLSASAALAVGKYQLEREAGRPSGVFTLVFRKFPQGWRIINDHTSVVKP